MNRIIWSVDAREIYASMLNYLMENFPLDTAIDVDEKVERLLLLLENNRNLCPPSDKIKGVRRCVISPYLSMIYRTSENEIEIVAFVDNRMEHPF